MMTHPTIPARRATGKPRAALLPAVILLTAVILSYFPIFRAGYIWDDPDYIVNNLTLRSLLGLWHMWIDPLSIPQYYPLVHTTFWIEYHLWQLHPLGYHIDNLLLHALGCILFWRLLVRLEVPGAFVAALFFAIHPVQVESVAWITERKNVLCGVFYFSAFHAWLRFDQSRSRRDYIALCFFFLCALLSKTISATLPAAALVIVWWKRGRITWRDVRPLLPLFVFGAIAGSVTAYIEHHYVGASGKEWGFTPIDRILIAGRAVWFYLYKLVLPINLCFIYPKWTIDWHIPAQYIYPVAAVACVFALFLLRHRIGRAPLAVALLFIGTLFPALGFTNIYPMRYSFVADHFQYLACAVIFAAVAALLRTLPRAATIPLVVAIALSLSALTFARTFVYHDALALWTDTMKRNPNSFMVHFNYAEALLAIAKDPETSPQRKSELEDQARRERFEAMRLAPDLPETHWNVGVDYAMLNRNRDAMREFQNAIDLDSKFAPAYNSIGLLYLDQNDLDRAYDYFDQATKFQSGYATAQFNAGLTLERKGDTSRAIQRYENAIAGKPDYVDAYYNLANCLMRTGHLEAAVAEFRMALYYKPDKVEAMTNLGAALLQLHRPAEAAEQFQTALRINPNLEPAKRGLAAARRALVQEN
jgi:protein O-mannosyl-transferase